MEAPPLLFFDPHGRLGCLSTFSRHGFFRDGRFWPSGEHYFQAKKSPDPGMQEWIRRQSSPGKAKLMGWRLELRSDWEHPAPDPVPGVVELVKDSVMHEAVFAKFWQNRDIRAELLATGDSVLIHAADQDDYWGWGPERMGTNRLGRIAMHVREALRAGKAA